MVDSVSVLITIRWGEAYCSRYVGERADFQQVFELCITNPNTLLKTDAGITTEEMRGNLTCCHEVPRLRCGNGKIEEPAAITSGSETNVSNRRFVFHESSPDQPEGGV